MHCSSAWALYVALSSLILYANLYGLSPIGLTPFQGPLYTAIWPFFVLTPVGGGLRRLCLMELSLMAFAEFHRANDQKRCIVKISTT